MARANEERGSRAGCQHRLSRRSARVLGEETTSKTLRLGWIGCGTHANEMLLPQITRYDVAIVALCDTDADRLGSTARRYGVPAEGCLRDWQALLARHDIDVIGI